MTPPRTRRDAVVETLHGVDVPDPYRWLEDGDDADVQRWVADQNRYTASALEAIPSRETWLGRLVAFMGLPVVQSITVRGDALFLLERAAGAQQARLVRRSLSDPSADPVVLADPAGTRDDAAAAVDWYQPSVDGSLVAFGVSEGGTENSMLRVIDASTAELLPEEIPNCRAASVAWEPDGSGFAYTRYPEGDEYHRTVHHHTLGADGNDDPVLWAEHPNPQAWPSVQISPDRRYVLVSVMLGWSRVDQHLLDRSTGSWTPIVVGVEAVTNLAFVDDERLIGVTTISAPHGRLVEIDIGQVAAGEPSWTTIVPEGDGVIETPVATAGGALFAVSTAGVDTIMRWSRATGSVSTVGGVGVSAVVQLTADVDTGTELAIITGFDAPPTVFRLDDGLCRLHPAGMMSAVPELEVRQVEYRSIDGTMVGMFLVSGAGAVAGPDTPTILNGYGGFAITETPVWSPMIAAWCAAGGVYAIAGLRGGAEHGESWHEAGMRANKQNVFDDFHAAADWLVDEQMTSRDRLAIAGGSNGGLLVGAALTQRPDLCRAVWCAVPLLDMIRFPEFLIARLWTAEYGDPAVAEEFAWIHAYSPYHHVHEGTTYPSVLLTTAAGDTRVDPLHARKMAALLQACAADLDECPVLLHQESEAGHGVGKPVGKRAAEQADVLAFFSWQLGFEP